ncbi:MAG TPA: hypothetical protein VGE40_05210, partial [Bacilli bacterium]
MYLNKSAAMKWTSGTAKNLFHYSIVISLSFVFVYPMLFLLSQSLMQPTDLTDATVDWIPRKLLFNNYIDAFNNLQYWKSLKNITIISVGSALVQVIGCAAAGYGLARFRFPGDKIVMVLVVFTFLVPPQTIIVPLFLQMSSFGWINTYLPFIVPGML